MITKKICLLGATGVGKTSLAQRFVSGVFSERYLTTVGVKIDKKTVQIGARKILLLIWDLSGEDDFYRLQSSYLRGAAACLLVADGLRPDTLAKAMSLQERAQRELGAVPFELLLNKSDLAEQWQVGPEDLQPIEQQGWPISRTSAKTGDGVEAAFERLGRATLG